MASRDLHSTIQPKNALSTTAIAANGVTNGSIIDTSGFKSLEFLILSGTLTDGSYTPSLTEGDDSALADGATATQMLGTIANATFALTDDNVVKRLGYSGSKRYVRLNITAAAVTSGGTMSAIALLANPNVAPTPP